MFFNLGKYGVSTPTLDPKPLTNAIEPEYLILTDVRNPTTFALTFPPYNSYRTFS